MDNEKITALLEMFKDDRATLDSLLEQAEAAAPTWTGKAQIGALRARITLKATRPTFHDMLGGVSDYLRRTGGNQQ